MNIHISQIEFLFYFRVYTRGDIPRAILREEFVIVLEVNVLPDEIEDSYQGYVTNKNRSEELRRDQWFDDETVVGDMRYNTRPGVDKDKST